MPANALESPQTRKKSNPLSSNHLGAQQRVWHSKPISGNGFGSKPMEVGSERQRYLSARLHKAAGAVSSLCRVSGSIDQNIFERSEANA